MSNRTPREKIALEPIALIGLIITSITVAAGATWFMIQRFENAEIFILKNQVSILEDQIKIRNQEIQEKTDLLQKISTISKPNTALHKLIKGFIEEPVGVISPKDLWINEAILVPETNVTIAYENLLYYPYIKRFLDNIPIPIIRRFFVYPDILVINYNNGLSKRILPKAGNEIRFQHNKNNYSLFVIAVKEKSVRVSVFKDMPKS